MFPRNDGRPVEYALCKFGKRVRPNEDRVIWRPSIEIGEPCYVILLLASSLCPVWSSGLLSLLEMRWG
jgi:hypothetical protein